MLAAAMPVAIKAEQGAGAEESSVRSAKRSNVHEDLQQKLADMTENLGRCSLEEMVRCVWDKDVSRSKLAKWKLAYRLPYELLDELNALNSQVRWGECCCAPHMHSPLCIPCA